VDAEVARIIELAQAEGLQLTGEGGLLPGMIRQAVEAALNAKMTGHLGYERHAAERRGSGNSRNGYAGKTVQTAGPVELNVPRYRDSSFTRACGLSKPEGARLPMSDAAQHAVIPLPELGQRLGRHG
jgi:transposase-like protein